MKNIKKAMALALTVVLLCNIPMALTTRDVLASSLEGSDEEVVTEQATSEESDEKTTAEQITLEESDEKVVTEETASEESDEKAMPEETTLEESNDAVADAAGLGGGLNGWTNVIQGQFDVPYTYTGGTVTYKLDLPSSGKITQTFVVKNDTTCRTVFDSNGNELFRTHYDGGGNTYTEGINLIGGSYYFVIWDFYDGAQDTDITWHFTSAKETFKETEDNRNDNMNTAFPISTGSEITGQFAVNDTVDYYSFSAKAGAITLTANNTTDLINITIVNTTGTVNVSKEIKRGKDSIGSLQIPAGKYYIFCNQKDGV
ncbi:MAG: hypothetical protein IJ641_03905, partial [Lachnospiraceae bacterium]|nr:hypothetical protein [Lachnospiraceae bacterium]